MRKNKFKQDKAKFKARTRARNTRIQTALLQAREHEARLQARIALDEANTLRAAAEADYFQDSLTRTAVESKAKRELVDKTRQLATQERLREAKREIWPLGSARSLIRQGYSLEDTIQRTGWSKYWLADADILANLDVPEKKGLSS